MSASRHSDGNESCGSERRTSCQKKEPRSHPRWTRSLVSGEFLGSRLRTIGAPGVAWSLFHLSPVLHTYLQQAPRSLDGGATGPEAMQRYLSHVSYFGDRWSHVCGLFCGTYPSLRIAFIFPSSDFFDA